MLRPKKVQSLLKTMCRQFLHDDLIDDVFEITDDVHEQNKEEN